jgi:predicted anti-sigma-YlaC factor YlaD
MFARPSSLAPRPALAATLALGACTVLALAGCSIRQTAIKSVADGFAAPGGGSVFSSDDDPELVRDAIPVMIKVQEQLLDSVPLHRGLLEALARVCTQYGAGFLQPEAERVLEKDVARGRALFTRARRLFLRARRYGQRGLDVALPGFTAAFKSNSPDAWKAVLQRAEKTEVGLLYWTAAAWASAISTGKDDLALVGQLPRAEALMRRALELDEAYDEGAIHEFFILFEPARPGAGKNATELAKKHLQRALALSGGKKLAPLVSYAEAVTVGAQDKKEFLRLLNQVVATDVEVAPGHRLVNLLAQQRARWLLGRVDELFVQ